MAHGALSIAPTGLGCFIIQMIMDCGHVFHGLAPEATDQCAPVELRAQGPALLLARAPPRHPSFVIRNSLFAILRAVGRIRRPAASWRYVATIAPGVPPLLNRYCVPRIRRDDHNASWIAGPLRLGGLWSSLPFFGRRKGCRGILIIPIGYTKVYNPGWSKPANGAQKRSKSIQIRSKVIKSDQKR